MTKNKRRSALFVEPVAADDVVIRCLKLADAVQARLSVFFGGYGITILQFNILRILYVRDPDGEGIANNAIRERLMVRAPDLTRLLDRLNAAGLIERFRPADDRRVVRAKLTRAGTALVEKIQTPLLEHNCQMLSGMSQRDIERLSTLLGQALDALV